MQDKGYDWSCVTDLVSMAQILPDCNTSHLLNNTLACAAATPLVSVALQKASRRPHDLHSGKANVTFHILILPISCLN